LGLSRASAGDEAGFCWIFRGGLSEFERDALISQFTMIAVEQSRQNTVTFGLKPHFIKVFTMVGVTRYTTLHPDERNGLRRISRERRPLQRSWEALGGFFGHGSMTILVTFCSLSRQNLYISGLIEGNPVRDDVGGIDRPFLDAFEQKASCNCACWLAHLHG